MYKLLLLLVFVTLLTSSTTLIAQDKRWVYFSESIDGIWYYDVESIEYSKSGSSVEVWIKVVRNPESFTGNWIYELHHLILYCKSKEISSNIVLLFYSSGDYEKVTTNNLEKIAPESNGESLFYILCR